VALVGRAFKASGMLYTGDKDPILEDKIGDVNRRWGGDFKVCHIMDPIRWIKEKRKESFKVIHLTMYGLPLNKVINDIRKYHKIILIVGSEKVDPIFFKISDYNIAVGNQPHSEVAAIAVFLDRYFEGGELDMEFTGGEYYIIPSERDKIVRRKINH
jgi:tRNA (cytidine56-2'-O)-methyltransferase